MISLLTNIIMMFFFSNSFDEKVQNFIMDSFPGYQKYEVKIVSLKSREKFVIDKNRPIKRDGNLVYVPVEFLSDKGKSIENYLTCEVKLFDNVLVAKREIQKGKNIEQDDFNLELVDVSKINSYLTDINEVSNHRSATFIKKGELLLKELIEENPLIRAGDKVIAHSISGATDVHVDAVTQQDGWAEMPIRIKTRDKKLFKAKVLDSKNVLIIE